MKPPHHRARQRKPHQHLKQRHQHRLHHSLSSRPSHVAQATASTKIAILPTIQMPSSSPTRCLHSACPPRSGRPRWLGLAATTTTRLTQRKTLRM